MLRKLSLSLLLVSCLVHSQQDAWVYFTDKPNVTAALANPISILTQKAIDRKLNFNIPIDVRDVPVNETYISDLKAQTGITVLAKSKWFNNVYVRGSEQDINALINLPYVDYVDFADKNLNTTSRQQVTEEIDNIEEQAVVFNYGDTQNQVEMINVDNLHVADFTGEGITIAVMDSGFPNVNTMGAFQRLRDNGDLLDGYDFVDRTDDVYAFTGNIHGTIVLSDMAAYIENEFVGTAPDASYYLFRTEDVSVENPVEESYWVEAAERADSLGVDIINTSLGYTEFDNPNYSYTPADMNGDVAFITKGATIAVEKGVLVVVSAGNAGATAWQTVGAPADSPSVLTVGGVDLVGDYVAFSSQGSSAQVGYQKPDVVARGGNAYVVDDTNTIEQFNGTSFSAPILCGGIASLWQAIPNASPTEVMGFVRQSASQYTNPDNFLGYGIPDLAFARTLALDELSSGFSFYPNPVRNNLNIKLPSHTENVNLLIYDSLGKLVLNSILSSEINNINLAMLSSGIYNLKLESNTKTNIFKLLKY